MHPKKNKRIRFNIISPGIINSSMIKKILKLIFVNKFISYGPMVLNMQNKVKNDYISK